MSDTRKSLMDFVKAAKAQITELDGDQLEQFRQDNPEVLMLDVRESSEHEQGHIEGAHLVPRGILEAAADPQYPKHDELLVKAHSRPVVTYCASGGRSAMAAATLQQMGFEQVYSLAGGFSKWTEDGRPVVK